MKKDFERILKIFESEDDFLITSHLHPDGDSLGSELALYLFLRKIGKHAKIINQDPTPEVYTFLPSSDKIINPSGYKDHFKIACILDCFEYRRIGKDVSPFIRSCKKTINIDHHPGESEFEIGITLPSSSSTSEILYEIFSTSSIELDHEIALCLYTGILADTGSFGYAGVTSRTHLIVAELLRFNLDPVGISNLVYKISSPRLVKLLSLVLNTLTIKGRIAYVILSRKMLSDAGLDKITFESEFILRHIRRLDGVSIFIFFYELRDDLIKVSLRSSPEIDVDKIARVFAGGGHRYAAGCIIHGSLKMAIERCLDELNRI